MKQLTDQSHLTEVLIKLLQIMKNLSPATTFNDKTKIILPLEH